ncbi:DNA gyrase inhibitor YacG [Aquincola sp. S2]|uniref:DNA gyrase inhibitor YacG n=1 Tax=Pseudaquabacterium terrae TaxID=2732868 RepID=A0ABX2ETD8_9BURK|nr:DNA gyrase inhibitor YacG [Aquabacterium terrae]NRF71908.1 DNA gyrase inhibitor YacG [Aquabacterium terrae]
MSTTIPGRDGLPAARKVPCPSCGGPSLFAPSNRWRPFCSERCRNVDLGAWATERYRVAAPPDPSDDDDPPPTSS